jgi:hypothetical protein
MSIYKKLAAIQSELKAPKNQFNDFGDFYYRNCEDILEAVKPLCRKHETVLILKDEIRNIGDRYYVTAIAELIDIEKPDDRIIVQAHAREEESKKGMDGSQITGASSSYARKYALNGLFNIDDNKDSDTTNKGEDKPQKKSVQPKMTQTQLNAFKALQIDINNVAKYYGVKPEEITAEQAQMAIEQKQKWLEEKQKAANNG